MLVAFSPTFVDANSGSKGLSIGDSAPKTPTSPTSASPIFPPRSPAVPTATPSPMDAPLTPADSKKLLKEFTLAQSNELSALKHRNKTELKELKASHSARLKEWEQREREARHQFFAENKKGPARRTYIQDYLQRRKLFLQMQTDEKNQRTRDGEVRYDSLKVDQAQRLKEFNEALARGERPPARLWPSGS